MTSSGSPLQLQVDAFLHYLRVERQLSAKTRESYQPQLYTVIVLIDEMGLTEWRQLEVSQVRALAARSKRQGLHSLALRLSALRSFLDWLVSTDALGAKTWHAAFPRRATDRICQKTWMWIKLTTCWISILATRWPCATARCLK